MFVSCRFVCFFLGGGTQKRNTSEVVLQCVDGPCPFFDLQAQKHATSKFDGAAKERFCLWLHFFGRPPILDLVLKGESP